MKKNVNECINIEIYKYAHNKRFIISLVINDYGLGLIKGIAQGDCGLCQKQLWSSTAGTNASVPIERHYPSCLRTKDRP